MVPPVSYHYVDVLQTTGPALLERALDAYCRQRMAISTSTSTSTSGGKGRSRGVVAAPGGHSLVYLRRAVTGEDPSDRSTWDRASLIMDHDGGGGEDDEYIEEGEREGDCAVEAASTEELGREDEGAIENEDGDEEDEDEEAASPNKPGPAAVLVLPYCFFRSRGCPHLLARFRDRVAFHHEFDTDWRQAWWHNYYQHAGE